MLTNDSDPDSDPLSVTTFTVAGDSTVYPADGNAVPITVGSVTIGTLALDGNGAYTFTPTADWNGTVPQITYTVSDGNTGGTASSTLDLTVTPVQDAVNDTVSTHAGQAVTTNVLGNDSFEGANPVVSVATGAGPSHGSVTVNSDNTLTYTPTPGYVGQDTYTYTVTSGGVTETATVSLDVVAPYNDTGSVTEAGLSSGTDPLGGGAISSGVLPVPTGWTVVAASGTTANGSYQVNADGSYSFTLTSPTTDVAGVNETNSFTYTAQDAYGNSVTSTVTIIITDDVPTIVVSANSDAVTGSLTVYDHETVSSGTSSATLNLAGAFTQTNVAGADGLASGPAWTYALNVNDPNSGLTSAGQAVTLSLAGTQVTGKTANGDTVFTLDVDANGMVTIKQYQPIDHPSTSDPHDTLSFAAGKISLSGSATVVDGDGDSVSNNKSIDLGTRIVFTDDGPTIGSPVASSVSEASLPYGSAPNSSALTTGGSLAVSLNGDDTGGSSGTTFTTTQVALDNMALQSGGTRLTYTISSDGKTLVAMAGTSEVFKATINTDGTYSFTLEKALDHGNATQLDLPFAFTATDGDGDTASKSFIVTVVDDQSSGVSRSVTVSEDGSSTFNTTADANVTIATNASYGTAAVNAATGQVTYTPNSNYSGTDSFTYTITNDDGSFTTTTVNVTVTPVADKPNMDGTGASTGGNVTLPAVTTNEDTAVALGLKTPIVTDAIDQNGTGAGDAPERLGSITLSGVPAGASLLDGNNSDMVLATSTDSSLQIWLTDVSHPAGMTMPLGAVTMTSSQFEALKVLPPAESGANFTITASVTSYEVDDSGARLSAISGAISTASVTVGVQAVTDGATLTSTAPATMTWAEDTTLDLTSYLTAVRNNADGNGTSDTDGSETYSYTISGLPQGAVVNINGTDYTVDATGVAVTPYTSAFIASPTIKITPPLNYSGDMGTVSITLNGKDTDSDSSGSISTVSSTVAIDLTVTPVAGDVVAGNVSTNEDIAVTFLQHVQDTDTGTGTEVINKVAFEIPTDWTVTAPTNSGGWSVSGDGSSTSPYTITFDGTLTEAQREAVLHAFTIKPPAQSSVDATIDLAVTTTDTNGTYSNTKTVTSADVPSLAVKVTVTPVAERVGSDVDGDGTLDLTMNGDHSYSSSNGLEDTWFALGNVTSGPMGGSWSGLGGSGVWTNQDTDEFTYAVLRPVLNSGGVGTGAGDSAIGTTFRYSTDNGTTWTEVVYTGTPVWVPAQYLDTLQFRAPSNVAGSFSIEVNAATVDYDDDADTTVLPTGPVSSGAGVDVEISGAAKLDGITIDPVADGISSLSLNGRAVGLEDTPIPLSITPRSVDDSETFNITIRDIPDGAIITYGEVVQSVTSGSVTISGFNPSTLLTITPPPNSNEAFTLRVTGTTSDGTVVSGVSADLPIPVTVHGVADAPKVTEAPPAYSITEANLDDAAGANHQVALSDVIQSVASVDTDGSETFSVRITGLADGFSLSGATLLTAEATGTDRVWVAPADALDNVFVNVPENFSGVVNLTATGVSTENDGDSTMGVPTGVSFSVAPSVEATATTSATLVEDEITSLNFGVVHQNGDNDETLVTVWIAQAQASDAGYMLYLGTGASAKTLAQALAAGDIVSEAPTGETGNWYKLTAAQAQTLAAKGADQRDGALGSFSYKYEVTDDHYGTIDTAPADTAIKDGTLTLTATAVTDPVELSIDAISGSATTSSNNYTNDDANPDTATVTAADTTVTVNLKVVSVDYDGSEHVVRVLIDNVPNGVTIDDSHAQQTGTNSWLLVYEGSDAWPINAAGGIDLPVKFVVGPNAGGITAQAIAMTVQSQDNGEQATPGTGIASDSVTWYLTTAFTPAEGSAPAIIDKWNYTNAHAEEDTSFTLKDVINADITIQDNTVANTFTVTVSDLPTGTQIDGMVQTVVNGQTVWTKSITLPAGTDDASAEQKLDDLLASIQVTPPANWNENQQQDQFNFDATLTTSVTGGASAQSTLNDMNVPVDPVTDAPVFTVNGNPVDEGASAIAGTITLTPATQDYQASVVDGKLYVQLDTANTTDAMEGGTLSMGGIALVATAVSGVSGVPDGNYYVIDVSTSGGTVDLSYTMPSGSTAVAGTVAFTAYAQVQEANAAPVTVSQTGTVNVQVIDNGVTVSQQAVTGNESAEADPGNAIELTGAGGLAIALNDNDGSESFGPILLSNIPVGFLVYVGADAGSAELASNAGGDGSSNTWVLSQSGGLPAYVAILPPAHWSGTIDGLSLTVTSGEDTLASRTDTVSLDDLTVLAVPDGVALTPTQTFGAENSVIPLNLNASMADSSASVVTGDESTETTTLTLTGLGAHASFYLNGTQIAEGIGAAHTIAYDSTNDVYTITGLTQDELYELGFKQAQSALTDQDSSTPGVQIGVEAWTVESADTSVQSSHDTTTVTLQTMAQQSTSGDDTLLWTGAAINGGAGTDTIQLRYGENLTGSELSSKLSNVEVLDLSVSGSNSVGTSTGGGGLSVSDVLSMTGSSSHTLTINGTADDGVVLSDAVQWQTTGIASGGYVTYTGTVSGSVATLLIDQDIYNQGHVTHVA